MQPVNEIAKGVQANLILAVSQPQYRTLPVLAYEDGTMVSRWKLSWRERLRVLLRGDLWLSVLTYNQPFQPVKMTVESPFVEGQ